MASFLVKVKPESPLRSSSTDTNHHFLYPLNGRPSAVTVLELLYNGVARYDDLSIPKKKCPSIATPHYSMPSSGVFLCLDSGVLFATGQVVVEYASL